MTTVIRPAPRSLAGRWRPPLALLLLAVSAVACHRERDRARALAIDWRPGQTTRYAARMESHAGLAGQSPFDLDLAATLSLTPLAVAGGRVELALALSDTVLKVGGSHQVAADNPLMAALAQPYLFTLDGGRIVEQRFAPSLSPVAAGIVRGLAAAFQLAARPAGVEIWTAREVDGTGAYEAEYRLAAEAGAVSKRKRRYETVTVAGAIDGATRARIVPEIASSAGTMRVAGGVLASIRLDDAVRSQVLMKSSLAAETKVAIDLAGVAPAAGTPTRAALLAATVAHPVDRAYGDSHPPGMFDEARIDGRTFEELLAALEASAADPGAKQLWQAKNGSPVGQGDRDERAQHLRSRAGAFSGLVALLRLQPEAIPKAVVKARSGSPVAQLLFDGLAAAGTEPAQAALGQVVSDRQLDAKLRATAASSLIRVPVATPRTVATLDGLVADPQLGEYGVFGLGTAARRLREAAENDRSRQISERLLGLLAAAKTPVEQIRCLRGIANSAYPGALEPLRAFLSASDVQVRSSAVEAVGLVQQPAADAFIAAPMVRDPDARVRISAVRVAAGRHPSDALAAALGEVALHDANVAARKNAVELLGRWLPDRRNLRPTLEEVVAKDDRPEIRAAAQIALSKA
jgi:hypothetical protein